jgi:class 3 adenylate cyclase
MAADERAPPPAEVATEAIAIIDIVDATKMSNRFGWYAVGRGVLRDLRSLIARVALPRGLTCQKSTGDGYLLTFRNQQSAELAAILAVESIFELFDLAGRRNRDVPEEQALLLRSAVHIGEVDVLPNDREGPHVSFAFRHEAISRATLAEAINPIDPAELPLRDYLLCSEAVADILRQREARWQPASIGLFRFKGFTGFHEVFRVVPNLALPC